MSESASTYIAPKVSMQTKLSYGYGSFGKDFSLCVVNTFLFFYLTDVANVSAATVGIIFLAARIYDFVNDPIFGALAAMTKTRWGKYKPWILIGNILQCFFLAACFCTHNFEGTAQIVYLTVVYICWGMAYTMCDAPFWSLIPNITTDKHEREGLLPYPRFAATVGSYMASGLGVYAVNLFGAQDDGTVDQGYGYMVYATIGGLLAISSALVTCKWTDENFHPDADDDKFTLKDAFFVISHNKQFLIFLTLSLLFTLGVCVSGALNLYVFKYCVGDETMFSTFQGCALITTIPTIVLFTTLVRIFGRRVLFTAAFLCPVFFSGLIAAAGWGILPVLPSVILAGVFNGFQGSVQSILCMIMVADCIDFGDYRFHIRSECIYYALNTMLFKCSNAFAAAFIGLFLTWINYQPNTEQTQATIDSMLWFYWGMTFLGVIAVAMYLTIYHLNGATLDKVQRTLMRRKMDKLVKDEAQKPLETAEIAAANAEARS